MLANERKSRIIEHLEREGRIEVSQLARVLDVVPETIRRDLREFEKQGVLVRTHGGAVLQASGEAEYPSQIRALQENPVKDRLCREAVRHIQSDDLLFVDNSTTLLPLIRHIDERMNVTILTNSIQLLQEAAECAGDNLTLLCTGGIFNRRNLSLSGTMAGKNAFDVIPTKAFISCHGLSAEYGLTDANFLEVGFKREMLRMASEVFLLVDRTKFGRIGPVRLGNASLCTALICDEEPPAEFKEQMLRENPALRIIVAAE